MYDFFKRFLRDSGLLEGNEISNLSHIIDTIGLDNPSGWAIMLTNLSYTPQINWLVRRLSFGEVYAKDYVLNTLVEDGAKESWVPDIWSSFTRIANLPFSQVGFGTMSVEGKKAVSIRREVWQKPDQEVVLYCLYKFAEACGDYKQFTLTRLMDSDVESDGITPTQIFGLDKETMTAVLNGLSANYPEFIHVSFTLDLDNITLSDDKTSKDVLDLFK
jgi:phosphoadenosine phosphosulfate reductase